MSKNKKIAMAINYDYPDYGGMLQAYASFRKIKDLGYEPEAINIASLKGSIRNRKLLYFAKNIFDVSIVKEKSRIVFKKLKTKTDKRLKHDLSKRYQGFETFCALHFKVSQKYASWEELSKACYNYTAVVVGSDQLWLPSNIVGDYYTLAFVPDNVKKIAYATSFGVSKIAKGQETKAKQYLNRIDFLSARERSGQNIIKECTGRDVQLVCDPALLLTAEEWDIDCTPKRIIKEKYIFCYFMGNNAWQRKFVKELRNKTGRRVVALLHLDQYIAADEDYVDEAPYDISPADFINLVKYADYVCTDSFHGVVFSITYGKTFFTFKRFSEKATLSTNTRIATLLSKMNLQNRLVEQNYDIDKLLEIKIDYEIVNQRLNEFRGESLKYLLKALEA